MSINPSDQSIQPAGQYEYSQLPGENTQNYQPITQQPVAGQHLLLRACDSEMAPLQQVDSEELHVGLRSLTTIDQLIIEQKVELFEVFTGWETNNKYVIKDSKGEEVYYAVEESDACSRQCCGSNRSFEMRIIDVSRNEIIHLFRDFVCGNSPCCLQKLEVCSRDGNQLGSVEQTWSLCSYNFDIKNTSGVTVLRIEGSACFLNCCPPVDFTILSADGSQEVGKISKYWSGLARELFTDADHFGISFPISVDVHIKAVLIGACFLIDFMCFENNSLKRNCL